MRITLTQFESGLPMRIDPQTITAITELPAYSDDGLESGARTRINGRDGMLWLVTQTAEEIDAMTKENAIT